MKKISLLFFLLPYFLFSQTTLVNWYSADFSAKTFDTNVESSPLKRIGGTLTNVDTSGVDNIFYSTGGWPKPNYSNPAVSSFSLTNYLQFTLAPKAGIKIDLAALNFTARTQGGTALMQIRYSTKADFSTYTVLQSETQVSDSYKTYQLNFTTPKVIRSGEVLYVRIYVYNTENNFHLQHNVTGTLAPNISGTLSLETPVAPVANDDYAGTLKNTSQKVDVLQNDSYVLSGALTAVAISVAPKNGTVQVNGFTDLAYTPTPGYTGYDDFYYTLTNASGVSRSAKVEMQIIDEPENVLVRWTRSNYTPEKINGINAKDLKVYGQKMDIVNYAPDLNGPAFQLSNLPTPQQSDGTLDPSKYLQMSLTALDPDFVATLKALKMKTKGNTGNMTIKYSRFEDFRDKVFTLVNDQQFGTNWVSNDFAFPAATFLYPGETLYIRIYTYNTWNNFFIEFSPDKSGPALTGIVAAYTPEPCKTTVTWTSAGWSSIPNINKRAILNADYDTSANGSFETCSLTVNAGKLTIAPGKPVTVQNEITVNPLAFLEVQNEGNLIQKNNSAINTGNTTVLRNISIGAGRTQYNYLGSPVAFATGENFKTLYPGIAFSLYHNETNNFFYSSSGVNIPGRGLAVKEPTTVGVPPGNKTVTAKYKGVPQNGIINFPLANSNTASNTTLGYNLLGNPYPSNIDLKKLYELNGGGKKTAAEDKISPTFYLWDNTVNNDIAQTQQGSGYKAQAYAVYNAIAGKNGMGNAAPGYLDSNNMSKKIPSQIIKVGQGFMVKALVKNYTLKFGNEVRTTEAANTSFFGKNEHEKESAEADDRFWVKMIAPTNLTSSMAVVYFPEGENTFGAEDSESKSGSDDLFSISDERKIAINGRSSFLISDLLPLGSQHFTSGMYTIAVDEVEGVFADGQSIYLKDKQTGILTNLSQGSYTFAANAGENSGRFEILYQPEAVLATDSKVKEMLQVYRAGAEIVVKSFGAAIQSLQVFEASGRLVRDLKSEQKEIRLPAQNGAVGLQILKITLKTGEIITRKIRN